MIVQTKSGTIYQYDYFSNRIEIVEDFPIEKKIRIEYLPPEKITALPLIDTFVIETTRKCNLRCSYCCYSGDYRDTRTHEPVSLTTNQVDDILDFIRRNHKQKPVNICFYGGEPLLEFPLIRYMVEKAEKLWVNDVAFFLSTNGILLSKVITDFLVSHRFTINISLDGTAIYHNKNRKTISGTGSFDSIYQNLLSMKETYPAYFQEKINLLMTIEHVRNIKAIAGEWQSDKLLSEKAPAHISNLSPNYAKEVRLIDEEQLKQTLYEWLDFYQSHPDNGVMKTFFEERIEDFKARPIFDLPEKNLSSNCLPKNRKCFIDVYGKIGVCEKMCDIYRIGDIYTGFDFKAINQMAEKMDKLRRLHCSNCEIMRLCDTCLLALDLNEAELAVNCHNQRIATKLYMLMMCEWAEGELI